MSAPRARATRHGDTALHDGTYVILVRSLFESLVPALIMGVSFVAVGILLNAQTPDPLLAALTGFGSLAAAARLAVVLFCRRAARAETLDATGARVLERRFTFPYLAFALIFGAFAARAFVLVSPESHMLLVGLVFGYGAGVVTTIALRPLIGASAVFLALVPTIVTALLTPHVAYWGTGCLLALFLAGGVERMIQRYRVTAASVTMQRAYGELARADHLTGLPNRLSLREGFQQLAVKAGRDDLCVIHCLDLDRFKPVNDQYGHPAGDALLCAVSERLSGLLRCGDFAARLGGDEFVIVQTGATHPGEADLLARRIARAIAQPFSIMGHQIVVGISIGYALLPAHGGDLDTLIARADAALVQVKREGGGVAAYSEPEPQPEPEMRLYA